MGSGTRCRGRRPSTRTPSRRLRAIRAERHAGVLRLFARTDGSRKARLEVEVVYANGRKSKATKLRAGHDWAPTHKLSVALGRAKGKGRIGTAAVALRFTPVGEPA